MLGGARLPGVAGEALGPVIRFFPRVSLDEGYRWPTGLFRAEATCGARRRGTGRREAREGLGASWPGEELSNVWGYCTTFVFFRSKPEH